MRKGPHVGHRETCQEAHHLLSGGAIMFSAWDFHSWIASAGVVLVLGGIIIGFGWLVTLLLSWIWGEEPEVAIPTHMKESAKAAPMRKAA